MSSYTKKKIISMVAPVLSGLGMHKFFAPGYAGLGHILTFHRVLPDTDRERIHNHLSLEISPEHLEATIEFYKKEKYRFVSLDQLHGLLKQGEPMDKFVAFTFDDGYIDNYTVAYPILKKHQVPFTIYITTNFPDHRAILWWYLLEDTVLKNDRIEFNWQGLDHQYACDTIANKEVAFDEIRTVINQSFRINDYKTLLKGIFNKTEIQLYEYSRSLVMSWEDIRALNDDPLCTIGAHTVSHYPLRQLNEDQLIYEINESRERIGKKIGSFPDHFAYPFGKVSESSFREFDAVKSLGFKTGTTTRIGNIFKQHRYTLECLPRISVNRVTNQDVLHLQASGMLPFIIHRGKRVITN